jgi:hypothetical protein
MGGHKIIPCPVFPENTDIQSLYPDFGGFGDGLIQIQLVKSGSHDPNLVAHCDIILVFSKYRNPLLVLKVQRWPFIKREEGLYVEMIKFGQNPSIK